MEKFVYMSVISYSQEGTFALVLRCQCSVGYNKCEYGYEQGFTTAAHSK